MNANRTRELTMRSIFNLIEGVALSGRFHLDLKCKLSTNLRTILEVEGYRVSTTGKISWN